MDGKSQRRRNRHTAIIQSWFDAVLHDGGIDRFDDLHVDRIDRAWKHRDAWISAALESFEIATHLRDDHAPKESLTIILGFALKAEETPLGVTFHDCVGLEKNLSYSPPSLYLVRAGGEFWNQMKEPKQNETNNLANIEKLNILSLFGEVTGALDCIYLEQKRLDDKEYSRDLFLAG
jgi:hypothetical protein